MTAGWHLVVMLVGSAATIVRLAVWLVRRRRPVIERTTVVTRVIRSEPLFGMPVIKMRRGPE